jgi:hypothetical protein
LAVNAVRGERNENRGATVEAGEEVLLEVLKSRGRVA